MVGYDWGGCVVGRVGGEAAQQGEIVSVSHSVVSDSSRHHGL